MRGVKFVSWSNTTGYGLAALDYLRALVARGVEVWWAPLCNGPAGQRRWRPEYGIDALDFFPALRRDPGYADLPALVERCGLVRDYDTVVVQLPPEYWPACFEPGKRNIGCVALETDRLPPHRASLLNLADRVLVPCTMNRDVCVQGGLVKPICVVPHILRPSPPPADRGRRAALRARLGAGEETTVFYSINTWDPRKASYDLLSSFAGAFAAADDVVLLLKAPSRGIGAAPLYPAGSVPALFDEWRAQALPGRDAPLPAIRLIAQEISDSEIEDIHQAGDVFVSLSHGEGWGLGGFEALARGRPVVMTGWGGHMDYLGADWPWQIDYRLEQVDPWPGQATYLPPQHWAQADLSHASRLFRAIHSDLPAATARASQAASALRRNYAPESVSETLLSALIDNP
jgi:glycosyltransferase involved in cell wall biosynthesis